MTSVVAICNLALSNIGKQNIQALSDAGAEARACNQFYEHTRDLLLQSYPWAFAGKTRSLGAVPNTKQGRWAHAYDRPNDCLKVRWVRPKYSVEDVFTHHEEIANRYEIEGNTIYCNLSPAYLRYTFRLTDPTRFSPLFVDALSWHLAVRLAMPLTRDPKVRAEAAQVAYETAAVAREADANEVRESSDHDSEMVEARS